MAEARDIPPQGEAWSRHAAREAASPKRRPTPAAPSPGAYVGSFDVREIIARLRPPMTAADAGVTGWRQVRFADGVTGGTAMSGSTRYEVRPDRLVVAVPIRAARSSAPPGARVAVVRVNNAIFGAQAGAVSERVMALVKRVAADRSGRTRFAQRIRGRDVRVDRVASSGLLVYAVHR